MARRLVSSACAALVLVWLALSAGAWAGGEGALAGEALVRALREGGFNVYFRHAETDWSLGDRVRAKGDWTSCDPDAMRQLADEGRETARRIGEALRALAIPVGRVLASPYCRTVETARLMGLGPVETTPDVMNTRVAEYFGGTDAIAARARRRLSTPPAPGTNTVLVAHGNVVRAATGEYPAEAGAVVFRPRGDGVYEVVARVPPNEWIRLAQR